MKNLQTTWFTSPVFLAVVLAIGFLVLGCSDGRLQLGEISGTVTIDGKPLPAGQIVFITQTRRGFGSIADGKIVDVTTYKNGDGVVVGNHKVVIRPKLDEAALMAPPQKGRKVIPSTTVPKKYHSAETSGLSAEVVAGKNDLVFELLSK